MIEKCLEVYAILICTANSVKITSTKQPNGVKDISVFVKKEDGGKLIGRGGCVIDSLKIFVGGSPQRESGGAKITVKTHESD